MIPNHQLAPLTSGPQFRPLPALPGSALRPLKTQPSFALALSRAASSGQPEAAGKSTGKAAGDPVATAKAASDLEGVFLNLLWQQMWRTVTPGGQGSGSYLPGGLAGEISRDFLTQGFADKMADAGGIGLAALVKAQLSR